MFKFFSRTRDRSSAHLKDKLGQDLFLFNKAVEHGFPTKPSAIAHDPALRLLAIGTSNGLLKIYGQPGVELSARHQEETVIQELHFLPEQGRIISVCDDGEQNTIHLWEVNKKEGKSVLEEVKTCTLEGRLKKISVCCLSMKTNRLYLGTEGGNIYLLDINSFELQEYIIYQDVVMQSVQEESKTNAGSVEAIQEHPEDSNKILIGYKKGLIVLWNHERCNVQATFSVQSSEQPQEVESVSWNSDGTKFISAHGDGSLTKWTIGEEGCLEIPKAVTPLGPFPCKAITKVEWSSSLVFFGGGMPRASYGDRHCVSLIQESKLAEGGDNTPQVTFDFTSHVVDFFTVGNGDGPAYLVVLCEEELVVIDLKTEQPGFPTFMKPYLVCLHSSPITCSYHCHDCPTELFEEISKVGAQQLAEEFSHESWPITGGKSLIEDSETKDVLITGHEDGSVNFWDVSKLGMRLINTVHTAKYFVGEHEGHETEAREAEEEFWPPFKKVGNYSPYSDDPRFAVTKIIFSATSKTLTVAGNGGQVLIFGLAEEQTSVEVEMIEIDFTEDKENFQWKGHGPLLPKEGSVTVPPGFALKMGLQLIPAAPISALVVETRWGLLAAGTVHGFILFDYLKKKHISSKWTVSQEADSGEHLSRRKSLKESIRRSFRRLRSRKGSKSDEGTPKKEGETPASPTQEAVASPVSRLVEENRVDESVLSMVRCLYFVDTFIREGVHHCPSLWAGTNAGHIYVFYLTIPDEDKRSEEDVHVEMGKELKLKHKAPVVSMFVVDKEGKPLLGDVMGDKEPDMTGSHSLVICSEEQFKVFSLPHLKARNKEKLTAIDGSRVRKIGLINATSKNDDSGIVYHCLACVSNQGDLLVYSIPNLKLQIKASAMKKSDVDAIRSLVFSVGGQGFFLSSRSEMQRFTLSATDLLKPDCVLELAEGMRPPEPEPEAVVEEKEEEKKERKSSTSSSSSSSSSSSDDEKDEEKKKEKKKKKKEAKKAAKEAAAAAGVAAVVAEVEEKKDEAEEKKEEIKEAKEELVEAASDDTAVVLAGDAGKTVTEKVFMSEQKSYTKQTSTSEEKGDAEQMFDKEISKFTSETEGTSSVVTSTRVVTSKVITTSSTTRVISSEGTTIETIENGTDKLMLTDDALEKAADEMLNEKHDEVEQAAS